MIACQACKPTACISQLGIFSNISSEHHDYIVTKVIRRAFKRGEQVLTQGNALNIFIMVSSGTFKCFVNHEEGKLKTLYFLHKGDFVGQSSLFNDTIAPYSIEAMEPSTVCMIDAKTIKELIVADPTFALAIVRELSLRIQNLESELSKVSIDPLDIRLLSLLHLLALDFGTKVEDELQLQLPLTQEELGRRLGVTRESVSRTLRLLEKQGKIQLLKNKTIKLLRM